MFPFVGTVVYTILRPPEFLEDREERELELRAAELRLRELIEHSCPHCEYPVQRRTFAVSNCERSSRSPCRRCSKPLDPKWGICPTARPRYAERAPSAPSREPGRRAERPRRTERTERAERTPRAERSERTERPERALRLPAAPSVRVAAGHARRAPAQAKRQPVPMPRRLDRPGAPRAPHAARDPPEQLASRPVADDRTLILVKPDAFERRLTGEVISRFERKGLSLVALKLMTANDAIANEHYAEHAEKPFFGEPRLLHHRRPARGDGAGGPELDQGGAAVDRRHRPGRGGRGLIRGEFGTEVTFNLVHGSTPESAAREIGIWFPEPGW